MERAILTQNFDIWKISQNFRGVKNWKFLREQLDHVRIHIGHRFGGNPASNKDSTDAKVDFDPKFRYLKFFPKIQGGGQKSKFFSPKVGQLVDLQMCIDIFEMCH